MLCHIGLVAGKIDTKGTNGFGNRRQLRRVAKAKCTVGVGSGGKIRDPINMH